MIGSTILLKSQRKTLSGRDPWKKLDLLALTTGEDYVGGGETSHGQHKWENASVGGDDQQSDFQSRD